MRKVRFWILGLLLPFAIDVQAEPLIAPADRYNIPGWEPFHDHTGFYPYLCEFGYRELADHIIDPTHRSFDPDKVKQGDIIYCAAWYLDWFTEQVHDKIPCPYLLITCDVGSWLPFPNHLKLVYDPKVTHWFGKNMLFTNHTKLFQIPMGQFYHLWAAFLPNVIESLNLLVTSPARNKDIFLYLNYTERDHARRIQIADQFAYEPYCFNRNRPRQSIDFSEYWDEISRSKFVLSPLGLEVDCTRTWECFVLDAIPIVEHSYLDPLYENLRILLIHDWNQVTKEFLDKQYEVIRSKPCCPERAFIPYWADVIYQKQERVRSGDLSMGMLEANQFSPQDLSEIRAILERHNKLKTDLIYQGNMSCLRPFQLAKKIESIPRIRLIDMWTLQGYCYIQKFAQDSSLFNTQRLQLCNDSNLEHLLLVPNKSLFLDLTHLRHKLLRNTLPLGDFCHSLEKDIFSSYSQLTKNDLLFGNMAMDPYVQEVVQRLKEQKKMNIETVGNFWFCSK